jgi:hypothetical protein
MKRLGIVLMAIAMPMTLRIGQAQSPSLSAARVHAAVELDSRNVFVYRYTVENGAGSNAGVWRLSIDISVPAGASMPPAAGLVHGAGFFDTPSGRALKASAAVPVGLSAPQPGWRTTVATGATARWVAAQDKSLVLPKQRLTGFSLVSHGPPAIRRFTLSPHIDKETAPVMEAGEDPGEVDRYEQELEQYVESRSVVGMTLAPTAPLKVTADALLANLANQVGQARSLRWIANDGVTRNITDQLQAARAAISKREEDVAANRLRTLRTDVAAQSGKALTSEAVALVDLNIRYALPLIGK